MKDDNEGVIKGYCVEDSALFNLCMAPCIQEDDCDEKDAVCQLHTLGDNTNGMCVPGCSEDKDCPPGSYGCSENNTCILPETCDTAKTPCDTGMKDDTESAIMGFCTEESETVNICLIVEPCTTAAECGEGKSCDATNSECVDADLIISEYIEGGSNNKALEIYNPTGAEINLSNYQLWKIMNGNPTWPEHEKDLSGNLAAGATLTLVNNKADSELKGKGQEDSFINFSGDDAMGIAKKDSSGAYNLIDVIGVNGNDPGDGWDVAGVENATKDHTLIRKATIYKGNDDWDNSRGTSIINSEWIVLNKNEFDYVGSHPHDSLE